MKDPFVSLQKKEKKEHLLDWENSITVEESINIAVDDIKNLYNRFDPSPIAERSLDTEAFTYICNRVDQISRFSRICITIHLPAITEPWTPSIIEESVTNYFRHKAEVKLTENHKATRRWLFNLLVGIFFLAACLFSAHILNLHTETIPFFAILKEGLSIIGWVALWEPAAYLLYGFRSDYHILMKYMRLHNAKIAIKTKENEAEEDA